jgi:hypothetical protein
MLSLMALWALKFNVQCCTTLLDLTINVKPGFPFRDVNAEQLQLAKLLQSIFVNQLFEVSHAKEIILVSLMASSSSSSVEQLISSIRNNSFPGPFLLGQMRQSHLCPVARCIQHNFL